MPGRNPMTDAQAIPTKRYLSIGEVSKLLGVKPHVLRYWEQEFPQLSGIRRRGNRRYYQQREVLLLQQIHCLLHDQGFTINGARQRLQAEDAREDQTQADLLRRQLIAELEGLLQKIR